MKVIMPMAGKGTRLLPLTRRVPKPLVNVAGRPVMDYVMDALRRAGQLDELIIITGHLKEKVEAYVRKNYDIPARFIEQKVLDGTAGAVNLARPYVDGPVIVDVPDVDDCPTAAPAAINDVARTSVLNFQSFISPPKYGSALQCNAHPPSDPRAAVRVDH